MSVMPVCSATHSNEASARSIGRSRYFSFQSAISESAVSWSSTMLNPPAAAHRRKRICVRSGRKWQASASTGQVVSIRPRNSSRNRLIWRWCLSERSRIAMSGPASTRMLRTQLFPQVALAVLGRVTPAARERADQPEFTRKLVRLLATVARGGKMVLQKSGQDLGLGLTPLSAIAVEQLFKLRIEANGERHGVPGDIV